MYSDTHIHTNFSGDCDAPVTNQIETAIAMGMKELCITDHHDFDVTSPEINFELDTERYISSLKHYREHYQNQIKLLIGIEFGHQPHLADYEKNFFAHYSFDYVVGSTHFIRGLDPYYPTFFDYRTEREAYQDYFAALAENLKLFQNYDSAGHLDYIVRYGPNKNRSYSYSMYGDYLDDILSTLIKKGKGLECNTSGFRQGLGQPNPGMDILRRYREMGGEILTLGSDAHTGNAVGYGFDFIGDRLKQCGYLYYATFSDRKPTFHKL